VARRFSPAIREGFVLKWHGSSRAARFCFERARLQPRRQAPDRTGALAPAPKALLAARAAVEERRFSAAFRFPKTLGL